MLLLGSEETMDVRKAVHVVGGASSAANIDASSATGGVRKRRLG